MKMKIDILDKKQGIVVYVDGIFAYRTSQHAEIEAKHIESLVKLMEIKDVEVITNGIID